MQDPQTRFDIRMVRSILAEVFKRMDQMKKDIQQLQKTKAEAEKKPEPASEPAPERREILEAKKERYLGILFAEVRSLLQESSMPKHFREATLSNIDQAAYDLGEAVFELAQLEKEENQCGTT